MNYFFRYFVQNSHFFNSILKQDGKVYFNASYLYNFKETCYNLLLKKNFYYFIDPESFKFQFGGTKPFYLKYIEYFKDVEDLFDDNNRINLEKLDDSIIFNDLYKKIVRFQQKTLAHSYIPLEYYMSIANENNPLQHFNPNEKLLFIISPYFEFSELNDEYYQKTKEYSQKNRDYYTLLRFPKEILLDSNNITTLVNDFRDSSGVLINILSLNEYDVNDLSRYFPNLIDLIYKFSLNNQTIILMNNSEFGKYFKLFGLNDVCSNVMIGQTTDQYYPFQTDRSGGSTDFAYIPQIHRSISFASSEVLIRRNTKILNLYPNGVSDLELNTRVSLYYDCIQDKINKINSMDFKDIIQDIEYSYNEITHEIHKKRYKYINAWIEILSEKYAQYY